MDEEDELHELCHNGEVDELRQFIRDAPAGYDFNQYENWKWRYTPLGIACKKGHLGIVKVLASHQDVNLEQGWVGEWGLVRTPLEIACSSGEDEIVKFLVEKQVEVTPKAFLNYAKQTIRDKKMSKIANQAPAEDPSVKRAEEARRHEEEQEREKISKENKSLTREVNRLKNEVDMYKDELKRQEERLRSARSRSDKDREALMESIVQARSAEARSPRRTSVVEVIKEVIKEVPVVKEVEVIREVIKEVPVPTAADGPTYSGEGWWGQANCVLEDTVMLNQKRINLTDRVEMVADHLRKYRKVHESTPRNRKTSGPINLRDDHNKISQSHEAWRKILSDGLKGFFLGEFGKDQEIDTKKIEQVIEGAHQEQEKCLEFIQAFYSKLEDLDNNDSESSDMTHLRQRKKLIEDLKVTIQGIADQYFLELPNVENEMATSDTISEPLEKMITAWTTWYNRYRNSSTYGSLSELSKALAAALSNAKESLQLMKREKSIFSLETTTTSAIPVVSLKQYPAVPVQFSEFLCGVYRWAASVQAFYKKQIRSDTETYRQQQAREEVRTRVHTIETQIGQHQVEEQEIEKMINEFQKIKISLKKLMSSIARDDSKLLDYEIMMEEADFNDDAEMTKEDIEQQMRATEQRIEETKDQLRHIQEQRRLILRNLRNFALRGHLLVLTNTEIFDTQGFRNELLRGGMEDLYLVGESITDYEQIESFAKSVAKYQHKQDSEKICVMKRYEIMDEQQVKFFRNELKLLRKMQHPFVGNVVGVLFTKTEAYIQLPFYSGGNLRDRMNSIEQKRQQPDYASKHEQRDFHEMKKIFHEVLQALAYLHSQAITHYDVKPENIVFDEYEHPILIDFGISEDPNSTLFTQNPENASSQIRGSVGYIAPEIKSGQPSSLTSDCWSFGVMLFEAFFAVPNLDLESLGLIELPPHQDEDLRALCKGLLNTDGAKRFTAAQALKSAFFSQKSYEKMFDQASTAQSAKKLEAFRHFLEVVRNKDRLFILNIHRDALVKDIFTEFRSKTRNAETMRFQTVVQYIGESGIDTGGLRRDLYSNFFKEICDAKYGMFELSTDKKFYYPIPDADRTQSLEEQYLLFGKILAKTMIDGDVIGDFFPITLFKFLADQEDTIDLSDVYLYDKQLYGNLQSLLMQSIEGWMLDWDINENPNDDEEITDQNKESYIRLKSRSVLIEQRKGALNAIKQGFQSVPELLSHLALLSPVELRLLLSGETYIDGEMVLHQIQFEERWDKPDALDTRKNLCKWIRTDATADQLKLVLMLTTASPTIPVGGFNPPIKVRYVDDPTRLPEGQTCVNMLMMPNYKDDYALLAKRFVTALENATSGFQLN